MARTSAATPSPEAEETAWNSSPREAQAQGLRQHIVAARETGLPLVIHSRECDTDMLRILQDETGKGTFPAVLHCFTGGRDLAFRQYPRRHLVEQGLEQVVVGPVDQRDPDPSAPAAGQPQRRHGTGVAAPQHDGSL